MSTLATRSIQPVQPRCLSVLVPAYDEARTIGSLLERVLAVDIASLGFDLEVVVVDDASTDTTAAIVQRFCDRFPEVRLVRHERNRGKAAAVLSALAAATGDYCIVQDADLEYSPDDYRPLLAAVNGGAEVVFGSRFLAARRPEGMRFANYLANRILTTTANVLFDTHLTDEATCLKLFPTTLLRDLDLRREGFDFCPEVTAKLGKRRIAIAEVPIRYQARSTAEGKKIRWQDAFRAMRTLIAERLSR